MEDTTIQALFWVIVASALAPIVADVIPRIVVPVVVLELLLGIVFGPHLLGLIKHSEGLDVASEFGVIFLFFLAGFEVDFEGIKGNPLKNAVRGWVGSFAIALLVCLVLQQLGLVSGFYLVAIGIATTALGPLMPILQDSGQISTRFGSNVLAIGAVGEFIPVLLLAVLFNDSRAALLTALAVAMFLVVVGGILFLNRRAVAQGRNSHLRRLAVQTLDSSAQFGVRISILLLVSLVFLAMRFELDILLGAFASGFIIGQLGDVASTRESRKVMEWMKTKFEAIGFGLFIPIFFVVTGAEFQLDVLLEHQRAMILLPIMIAVFLLVRGVPVMFGYQRFERRLRIRLALVAATQLPLVVTIMERLVASGDVPEDVSVAIIGAAIISVAAFPIIGFAGLDPASGKANGNGTVGALPPIDKAAQSS